MPGSGCEGVGLSAESHSASFELPTPVQAIYPSLCMATSMPQYQPIYHLPMVSGTHLIGSGPHYYLSNVGMNVGVNHLTSYAQNQTLLNSQPYYMKKKNSRQRYSARKEFPNGHYGEGFSGLIYQASPMGHFPGSIVQAATGVPIVLQQPIQSYLPAPSMHVPATSLSAPVFHEPPASDSLKQPVNSIEVTPDIPPLLPQPEPLEEAQDERQIETYDVPLEMIEPIQLAVEQETPDIVHAPAPAPALIPAPSEMEAVAPTKSWASLFKNEQVIASAKKPTARVEPFSLSDVEKMEMAPSSQGPVVDDNTRCLANHLSVFEPPATPLALLPRGLINKSNWCYINATLQALVACPPFLHLMKSLVPLVRLGDVESIPIIRAV